MYFALNNIFVFILGTVVGSFLNVCIYRLPRGESIVRPPSHCPHCKRPVRWYDNVPILSFLILRGRCRNCGKQISIRYAVVELISGVFFVWTGVNFGWSFQSGIGIFLFSSLLIVSAVDLEHQIIPDEISLGGLLIGLLVSSLFPSLHRETIWWRGLIQAIVGMLVGGGIIYVTGVLGDLIFRKESMGGGDVKLLAMLGAFLGWQKVILVYLLAPVLALPFGLFLKFVKRVNVLPYGPFLSLAGWFSFLWGESVIRWYLYGMKFY